MKGWRNTKMDKERERKHEKEWKNAYKRKGGKEVNKRREERYNERVKGQREGIRLTEKGITGKTEERKQDKLESIKVQCHSAMFSYLHVLACVNHISLYPCQAISQHENTVNYYSNKSFKHICLSAFAHMLDMFFDVARDSLRLVARACLYFNKLNFGLDGRSGTSREERKKKKRWRDQHISLECKKKKTMKQ